MKTKNTLITTAMAAAFALNMSTTAADAGHGDDLNRYAQRIDSIAHDLEDEFRLHYKHMRAYPHMRSDIAEIIRKTHHIEGLTDSCYASIRHISSDLSSLDRLAHHLHELVDSAEGSRRGGHVHGDTRHVHRLMSSLNSSIHSMQAVVERMRRVDHYDRGDHGRGEVHRGRGGGRADSYDRGRGGRSSHSSSGRSYSRAEFGNEVLRFVIESRGRR